MNEVARRLDLRPEFVNTRWEVILHLGATAVVEVTGLRNPCNQLNGYQVGLMAAVLDRREDGALIRKDGIMGVVLADGEVRPDDPIQIELPPEPHERLEPV